MPTSFKPPAAARPGQAELVVLRRFLAQGLESVSRGDAVSVRMGVVLVDLAAEWLVKIVVRAVGASDTRGALRDFVKVLWTDYPFVRDILPLREIRNPIMHDGTGPDPGEARRLAEQANAAMVRLAREALGLDLPNLALADFVTDERTKMLLTEAQRRLSEDKFNEAAAIAGAVFKEVMGRWTAHAREVFDVPRDTDSKLANMMASMGAGIFMPDLIRFRQITHHAHASVTVTGRIDILFDNTGVVEKEAAQFALDFAGGLAVQMEDKMRG